MDRGVNLIGEIDFMDLKVKVYNHPHIKYNTVQCAWTERDREMLPQFIFTGYDKIDDNFISHVSSYLDNQYSKWNPKK